MYIVALAVAEKGSVTGREDQRRVLSRCLASVRGPSRQHCPTRTCRPHPGSSSPRSSRQPARLRLRLPHPCPTGRRPRVSAPPTPSVAPSLLPALRTFHRVLTWQPRLARRWVPDRGRSFRHALSTLSHAGRGAMNTAAAPPLALRESPAASSSRVSALVGSTRVDRRLALRPPPARPPNCEAAAVCVRCVCCVAYVA